MSQIEKLKRRFRRIPIPNDITFDEVEKLANHYGCTVRSGGKHLQIVHQPTGTVIPIPRHGNLVGEAYIKQLRQLFDEISSEEEP